MTNEIGPVKGFRDYTDEEAQKRREIKRVLVEIFEKYGFKPAETPIIEYEEFVKGENQNDDTISDIFKLKDKGGRNLALRYEFTFQLKRIAKNKKLPYKRYQLGAVFRDEPVSENRLRQFTQCDIDTIGSTIKDEAEILAIASEALKKLGITPLILVNNRKLLNEILDDNAIKEKNKEQVLRELDKCDKLSESEVRENLKKLCAENVFDSIKKGEKYFSQFESYKEIVGILEYCKSYGIEVKFAPNVVRGLSYYNGTVFEIKTKGIRESIMGGGSYMVDGIQATGISFGLERVSAIAKLDTKPQKFLIVSLEQDRQTINIANRMRAQGKNVSIFYGKPSKALEYANSYGIENVIFIGAKEVKTKKFMVKDMKTGKQKVLVMQKVAKKNVVLKKKK